MHRATLDEAADADDAIELAGLQHHLRGLWDLIAPSDVLDDDVRHLKATEPLF